MLAAAATRIQSEGASLIVAGVVVVAVAGLVWREVRERRTRDPEPSPEVARHFRFQDVRRTLGVVVMLVVAGGIVYGSRIPPRGDLKPNPTFLLTWLLNSLLILGLVVLALIDWVAVRIHAGRVRRALTRERVEILTDELRRRRAADSNGRAPGSVDDLLG